MCQLIILWRRLDWRPFVCFQVFFTVGCWEQEHTSITCQFNVQKMTSNRVDSWTLLWTPLGITDVPWSSSDCNLHPLESSKLSLLRYFSQFIWECSFCTVFVKNWRQIKIVSVSTSDKFIIFLSKIKSFGLFDISFNFEDCLLRSCFLSKVIFFFDFYKITMFQINWAIIPRRRHK